MFFFSLQTKTSPWTLMKTRWVSTVEDLVGWEDPMGPIHCDPTPSQPSWALCFGRGPCHVMEACSSFSTWTWRSFWPRMGWGCTAMDPVPLAPRSHRRQVWQSSGSQTFFSIPSLLKRHLDLVQIDKCKTSVKMGNCIMQFGAMWKQ